LRTVPYRLDLVRPPFTELTVEVRTAV